jgi:micrococcal nuclease
MPVTRTHVFAAAVTGLLACASNPDVDADAQTESESGAPASDCGPITGTVAQVIDGDTIELASGERVRYLMIDTPESTTETECFGPEAKELNQTLVEGREITLRYDEVCTDIYDRLLAYVEVSGQEINKVMIERGYACVLHIPPNGDEVIDEYEALESEARTLDKGLWAACDPTPCG